MKNYKRLAFIEGGLVLLLELSCPQLVAPIFGSSIYTWAILLCLAVLSLAIGYRIGGFLSNKNTGNHLLKKITLLFGVTQVALILGLISFKILNTSILLNDFFGLVLTVIFLQVLPLLCLGATTPMLIELASEKNKVIPGTIYSWSTFGGILFSLLTGFVLIPEIGLTGTYILALLLLSLIFIWLSFHYKLGKYKYVGASFFCVSALFFMLKQPLPSSEKFTVIDYQEGLNGQLLVGDYSYNKNVDRILFINRMGQTWVNKSNNFSTWSYPTLVTALGSMYKPNSNVLILGLGGGILAKNMRELARHRVDAVEFDKRIINIAYDHFQLPKFGVKVYHEDARLYLNKCEKKYDVIVFDAFKGEVVPSHLMSVEAFQRAKGCLNKNGVMILNFNGFVSGEEGKSGLALLNTLKSAGFFVDRIPTIENEESNRNMLYVAYLTKPKYEKITLKVNTADGVWNPVKTIIKNKPSNGSIIITDDFPLMEKLNYAAAKKWRESYYSNFSKKFQKEEHFPFIAN